MRTTSAIVLSALVAATTTAGVLASRPAATIERRAEHPIAVCAVMELVNDLLQTELYENARTELEERLYNEKIKPVQDALAELQAEAQRINETGEGDLSALEGQYRQLQQQGQRAQQESQNEVFNFQASQIKEAYITVVASADAIAEDLGYVYLVNASRSDKEIKPEPSTIGNDILGRPLLSYPEETDITDDVREDLKLD